MDTNKETELLEVITGLQKQFGRPIVARGYQIEVPPFVSTSFEELDTLFDGGIRRGRLTHLMGNPTSGMTTLALKIIASIQHLGEIAVYIDLGSAFDPHYALDCGVDLAQLLLLRPNFETSLSILFDLVSSGIPCGVVLNATPQLSNKQKQQLAVALDRLHTPLVQSNCVFLLLTHPLADKAINQYANLRLMVELADWLYVENEVQGYLVRVTAVNHSGRYEGKTTQISIVVGEQTA